MNPAIDHLYSKQCKHKIQKDNKLSQSSSSLTDSTSNNNFYLKKIFVLDLLMKKNKHITDNLSIELIKRLIASH